jgi:hypothetical protein
MPFIDALALAVLCGKWGYRKLNVGPKYQRKGALATFSVLTCACIQ